MTDHDDLVRHVRAQAEEQSPQLPSCVSLHSPTEAEELLGFALP